MFNMKKLILFDSYKITETTKRVLGERRLRTLREFAVRASQLEDVESACSVSADITVFLFMFLSLTRSLL